MSGQDWSITIVALDSGGAAFQPDLMGAKPGDPLLAGNADLISWNNRTSNVHQPWLADAQYQPLPESQIVPGNPGNYLSDPIPAWQPSTPAYVTTAATQPINPATTQPIFIYATTQGVIYYVCKNHPGEHGQIIINA